jgi:hypothetical protein
MYKLEKMQCYVRKDMHIYIGNALIFHSTYMCIICVLDTWHLCAKNMNFERLHLDLNECYYKSCEVAWTNGTFLCKPKSKLDSNFGAKKNLGPKRRGNQGEFVGTCACLKCIPILSW